MARRVEYKHNQVALSLYQLGVHTTIRDTVHQDIDVEPHVLRATVNNTEIAISEETIRAALDLGGNADDPISYPSTLIMGCFQRMGYHGKQNDTQARKAGTDGLKMALQTAMVALRLNKRFNFPLYFYREMVMQINPAEGQVPQIQVPVQPKIPIPEQVPIPQAAVDIPIQEPVYEEVVHDPNQDLGMNMDDFVDDVVNSPIPETEGNVVTEADSSSSSSDTISSDDDNTDSDESRDFPQTTTTKVCSGSSFRIGKRSLVDESSDTDSDFTPDPTRQKLMSASIAAAKSSQGVEDANFVASLIITPPRSKDPSPVQTHVPPVIPTTSSPSIPQSTAGPSKPSDSDRITFLESQVLSLKTQRLDAQGELRIPDTCYTESIQRRDDEDNDPARNIEGDRQYTNTNPISKFQGESTSHSLEGNKDTTGTNDEEILLLEFFQDPEEEEAEKIECLDDIDDLFNDMEDDMSDTEIEEGEIVEIEIEKDKDSVTYEGCDGLKVPYNFIQDDVIPEFTYEGVTDSMDSVEDVTLPDDTADSKMDTDDESSQSNKGAETETTHTESPKINEEPVMFRDTGMTREQWREVPRIKYFNTLPRCEINGLASKPLINRSKNGLADVIANLIKKEGSSGKYDRLKPQKGKRVKNTDPKTGKKDQRTLRKNEIMYTDEWREQGLQYKRVLEICRRYGVHAGSRLSDNWKSSR
ncbi:hypothetical protein L1987_23482 [Smallanthus sonchifolius]|uniref:Uncharacterized protein n=1 Tax=Smallanthus sonchifolius TaxID=185202 RepID=A0ACB9IKE9_9ASTR|nr:hypothetical protein L1987_23482 [Smallanthus sonchifolius]